MVASLSKSLKLCHLLPTSRLLNSRLAAFSISNASLSSSSLPQSNPSPSPPLSHRLSRFLKAWMWLPQNQVIAGTVDISYLSLVDVKERRIFSKLLLFLPGAFGFSFATWQIFVASDKAEMLKYRIRRLEMEPVTCAELPFFSNIMDSLDFRRIVWDGDFDEKRSIFMGPYSGTISGATVTRYSVITPFIPREPPPGGVQTPVLVNRGWVPQEWRDKRISGEEDLDKASSSSIASNTKDEKTASWWNIWSKKPIGTAKEAVAPHTVKIVGVIHKSAKPSMFVQPNDPDGGHWYSVDVPMMARACGLSENAIYNIYIDEIKDEHTSSAKSPYPVPKDIGSVAGFEMMPKDHAKFAAKLYASSLVGTLLAVWKIKAKV